MLIPRRSLSLDHLVVPSGSEQDDSAHQLSSSRIEYSICWSGPQSQVSSLRSHLQRDGPHFDGAFSDRYPTCLFRASRWCRCSTTMWRIFVFCLLCVPASISSIRKPPLFLLVSTRRLLPRLTVFCRRRISRSRQVQRRVAERVFPG